MGVGTRKDHHRQRYRSRPGKVTVFQLIWIVLTGLVIGLLARLVVRGQQKIPLWLTIIIGIIGALIGNIIAGAIGVAHTGGVDWIRHILQVGVAAGLVVLITPVWTNRQSQHSDSRN